jgi:hypothetical protein
VSVSVVHHSNLRHPTSTRWSVSYTRLRVDLTRRRVLSTGCPLWSCISGAASLPLPPLSLVHFHVSMLLFSLFWVLYFEFLFLFSVFFRVPPFVITCPVWFGENYGIFLVLFFFLYHLAVSSLTHQVLPPLLTANFLGLRTKKP